MTCNYFFFWWWCWHVWSVASILPKIIQEKYDLYLGLVYSIYINSSNWMRNHMFNQHYSERSTLLLHVFSEMIIVTDEKQDVFSDERIQCKVNLSIQHWMHFSAEWHGPRSLQSNSFGWEITCYFKETLGICIVLVQIKTQIWGHVRLVWLGTVLYEERKVTVWCCLFSLGLLQDLFSKGQCRDIGESRRLEVGWGDRITEMWVFCGLWGHLWLFNGSLYPSSPIPFQHTDWLTDCLLPVGDVQAEPAGPAQRGGDQRHIPGALTARGRGLCGPDQASQRGGRGAQQ